MSQEILCINDKYSQGHLEFFNKHGVVYPKEGKIYNLRYKIQHSHGEWGLTVKEIVNPKVPIGFYSDLLIEQTFQISRFADLLGNPLEKVRESITDDNLQEHTLKETYNESRGKK